MKRVFYKLLFFVGLLGILNFIFLIFIGTVINFGILFPPLLGSVFVVYSLLSLRENKITFIKNKTIGIIIRVLTILIIISFLTIEGFIISSIKSDKVDSADFMVILGAGLKGDKITLTLKNRLDKAAQYLKKHEDLKVIVTGGQGPGETVTEAYAMAKYLQEKGIKEERILKEQRATSTMENFRYSKDIINKSNLNEAYNDPIKVIIVTSDFHMFRAKFLGERNGFKSYGLSAQTWWGILPNCCIREYFAIIKSFIFDRSSS